VPELFDTLKDWIAIESITGHEDDYGAALSRRLTELGFGVERQRVAAGRHNVLARAGRPEVVFCTHLDTVPPFFGPSEDAEGVRGRGACDAKGPALAMIEAARSLLAEGQDRIGFLFTVGEELDSAGAQHANAALAEPWQPRYTIVGEPTENRFVRAHKGVFKARLLAEGVAGHSSQDGGPSAVHELVGALHGLLAADWGAHPLLGPGTLNVGLIAGGAAPNVVAARAEASLLVRVVEDPAAVEARIRAQLSPHVRLECRAPSYGPVDFHVPEGETGISVAFGTDAPHLGRFGVPLLYGPGRIQDAHTDHERLSRSSFERAVADYRRTARELLARLPVRAPA
jgi:acetylornithine deacetylase